MISREFSKKEIERLMYLLTAEEFRQIIIKWLYTYNEIIIKDTGEKKNENYNRRN